MFFQDLFNDPYLGIFLMIIFNVLLGSALQSLFEHILTIIFLMSFQDLTNKPKYKHF